MIFPAGNLRLADLFLKKPWQRRESPGNNKERHPIFWNHQPVLGTASFRYESNFENGKTTRFLLGNQSPSLGGSGFQSLHWTLAHIRQHPSVAVHLRWGVWRYPDGVQRARRSHSSRYHLEQMLEDHSFQSPPKSTILILPLQHMVGHEPTSCRT
jgi:hypothetical protein